MNFQAIYYDTALSAEKSRWFAIGFMMMCFVIAHFNTGAKITITSIVKKINSLYNVIKCICIVILIHIDIMMM